MCKFVIWLCTSVLLLGGGEANSTALNKIRALHLVTAGITPDQTYGIVDRAKSRHFNTLILAVAWRGTTQLNSMPWAKPVRYQWTKRELVEVADYARNQGFEIVLGIELLTHQDVFFGDSLQNLMYNSSTYDPSKSEVYPVVFSVLDELIALVHPKAIHIGHDELAGYWRNTRLGRKEIGLREGEAALPAQYFLKDVQILNDYLVERGVETWMWGDMLISPDEFPEMHFAGMNGALPGYGKDLRDKLPRNIVICDWHYWGDGREFRSVDAFRHGGFRVLGATWKNSVTTSSFSKYAAAHGAEGMVSTTWAILGARSGTVLKTLDELYDVIDSSGEVFARDFPDGK